MPCGGSHLIKFVNVGGLSSGACATAGNSDGTSAYPRVPRNLGASKENIVLVKLMMVRTNCIR